MQAHARVCKENNKEIIGKQVDILIPSKNQALQILYYIKSSAAVYWYSIKNKYTLIALTGLAFLAGPCWDSEL